MSKKFSKKSAKKILFACESTQVKKLGLSSKLSSKPDSANIFFQF